MEPDFSNKSVESAKEEAWHFITNAFINSMREGEGGLGKQPEIVNRFLEGNSVVLRAALSRIKPVVLEEHGGLLLTRRWDHVLEKMTELVLPEFCDLMRSVREERIDLGPEAAAFVEAFARQAEGGFDEALHIMQDKQRLTLPRCLESDFMAAVHDKDVVGAAAIVEELFESNGLLPLEARILDNTLVVLGACELEDVGFVREVINKIKGDSSLSFKESVEYDKVKEKMFQFAIQMIADLDEDDSIAYNASRQLTPNELQQITADLCSLTGTKIMDQLSATSPIADDRVLYDLFTHAMRSAADSLQIFSQLPLTSIEIQFRPFSEE